MGQSDTHELRTAVLHGAGYVGRELIRLLDGHPNVALAGVTSESHAGQPLHAAHPAFRGLIEGSFSSSIAPDEIDVVFIAAGHGRGAGVVRDLLERGYSGSIIDMSADFRLTSARKYEEVYGSEHPLPHLLGTFWYGLPEIVGPPPPETKYVSNPGCFATAIALALYPLVAAVPDLRASVTAMTGASGSGARASSTTHFPDRDGNVRAYRVLSHRHLPEIEQTIGLEEGIAFTPVSGPWTSGIWGTASVRLPVGAQPSDVAQWYDGAYGHARLIRLYADELPQLTPVAHSPFCDIGWVVGGREVVIGFALDNLMKGAASQAIQNMNLIFGYDECSGLTSARSTSTGSQLKPHHA